MKLNYKALVAGFAIIVATNVIALGGVAYNRSGEPDAVLDLSERELSIPYYYGVTAENSGLALRINCRIEEYTLHSGDYNCLGTPAWLNKEKLVELGFDTRPPKPYVELASAGNFITRKVFIVLEYDGAAYQRELTKAEKDLAERQAESAAAPTDQKLAKRVESAQTKLKNEQNEYSRLFVIDAGLDKNALRKKYADAGRYVIMQALVRPSWVSMTRDNNVPVGYITGLLNGTIHIPLEFRAPFEPFKKLVNQRGKDRTKPQYTVRVAFGKRGEPWVLGVETL